VKLVRDGVQLLRRPLLLDGHLITRLSLCFTEQVTCLAAGLSRHLPGLIGSALSDLAACLAGVLPNARRLGASDIRRRRLCRQPPASRGIRLCILRHTLFPAVGLSSVVVGGRLPALPACNRH
jgi:hypothetical protein